MNHFEVTSLVRSALEDFFNQDIDYKLLLDWHLIQIDGANIHVEYTYAKGDKTIYIHIPKLSTYIFEPLIA